VVVDSRRKVLWIVIAGATCLFAPTFSTVLFRQDGDPKSTSYSPIVSPSPNRNDSTDNQQDTPLTQNLAVPPQQSALELEEDQLSVPSAVISPPPANEANLEIHRKIAAGINAKIRSETRRLYGSAFQQLGLSVDTEEKVIDILTQQQKELEQQAFEAAQSGQLPMPPTPEAMRAQQVQQDQKLRSILGETGFGQFDQYRATIPDRLIVDAMNQQGGNLSESQSQQLLQLLTQARQQIMDQPGITQSLGSMAPDKAMTFIQQQQSLLQQTVGSRVQNILTPDQATLLQGVLSQNTINPKVR
jgi:hypothetical protein